MERRGRQHRQDEASPVAGGSRRLVSPLPAASEIPRPSDTVRFAHASERQFAQLLDFYEIAWQYEPTSFDIEWDDRGAVTQRFTPDFFLPEFDLYIEITTLNQKLVTKKNRKVRRLRERYPEVRCKIFYQRDYLSLVTKYDLEDTSG
jgi:hypoxanthine phosphoribosyltransferase